MKMITTEVYLNVIGAAARSIATHILSFSGEQCGAMATCFKGSAHPLRTPSQSAMGLA